MLRKRLLVFLLAVLFCLFGIYSVGAAQSTHTPVPATTPTPVPSPAPSATPDALLQLLQTATADLTSGNYDKALEEYNQVLAQDAKNYMAFYGVGDIQYHVLQDCDKAVEAYRSALEFEPFAQRPLDHAVPLAYAKIGDCLGKAGDYAGAIEALNQVPQYMDVSTDTQFYYIRGRNYLALGDEKSAADDYSAILKLDAAGFASYLYTTAGQDYQSGTPDDLNDAKFHLKVLIGGMGDIIASGSADAQAMAISAVMLSAGVDEALGNLEDAAVGYLAYIALARQKPTSDDITVPTSTYTVEMHEGSVYQLTFKAHKGDVIDISAIGSPFGKVDPLIILMSPSVPLVANDDEDSSSLNSHIDDFTLPADGTYTLVLTHAGGGSEGSIRLVIELKSQ